MSDLRLYVDIDTELREKIKKEIDTLLEEYLPRLQQNKQY